MHLLETTFYSKFVNSSWNHSGKIAYSTMTYFYCAPSKSLTISLPNVIKGFWLQCSFRWNIVCHIDITFYKISYWTKNDAVQISTWKSRLCEIRQSKSWYVLSLSFILFILHRLRNKLSAYINHPRCLLSGYLTSTLAVCLGKSQHQNPLITGLEPGTFCARGSAPLSSTNIVYILEVRIYQFTFE